MRDVFHDHALPIYACECGHVTCDPVTSAWGDNFCPECDRELPWPQTTRQPRYVTVAVYCVTREYGGPEEGGWYYDYGMVIPGTQRSYLPEDAPQADIYRETMLHRYADMPRGDVRYSVRVWAERDAPDIFPEERPHYC